MWLNGAKRDRAPGWQEGYTLKLEGEPSGAEETGGLTKHVSLTSLAVVVGYFVCTSVDLGTVKERVLYDENDSEDTNVLYFLQAHSHCVGSRSCDHCVDCVRDEVHWPISSRVLFAPLRHQPHTTAVDTSFFCAAEPSWRNTL